METAAGWGNLVSMFYNYIYYYIKFYIYIQWEDVFMVYLDRNEAGKLWLRFIVTTFSLRRAKHICRKDGVVC